MQLSPVLRLIYFLLRLLTAAITTLYYRRYTVLGRPHTYFDGPAIIVSNHPSTLMEPLNVGLHIQQEMFFLANYGLFRHPVSRWILTRLYCIPVKRREDVSEGESRNNDEAFEKSYQHMEARGVLYIAAEGVSWMHRWVRDFKTGAARIAFGAERRNQWALDVKIIPVGLDYAAPHHFRSNVTVHFGAPVLARDWQVAYETNPEQAVNDLTDHLQRRVTALTVHAFDEAGEQALQTWETIAHHDAPLSGEAEHLRSQHFARVLLQDTDLRHTTEQYSIALSAAGLLDAGVKQHTHPLPVQHTLGEWMFMVLTLPLFTLGFGAWCLPLWLPDLLNRRLGLYIGYSPAVKALAGLFTVPLGLWAAVKCLLWMGYFTTWPVSLVALLLVVAGVFAERYLDVARRVWARWKCTRVREQSPEVLDNLLDLRTRIAVQLHDQVA